LPEGSHQVLEYTDLERLAQNEDNKQKVKQTMLQEFVNTVKQEIVIGDGCFIF